MNRIGDDCEYSDRYEAYYSVERNEWLEPVCNEVGCEFCTDRPDRPLPSAVSRSGSADQGCEQQPGV